MNPACVTILIPTYNRPDLLRRAVESVQAQSFDGFILRIRDNGTDAATLALGQELAAADPRVDYARNPTNLGSIGNIDQLIASVDTEYFCFLCDDDVMLLGFLAATVAGFTDHPGIGFSAARVVLANLDRSYLEWRNRDWRTGLHQPGAIAVRQMAASHFTSTVVLFHRSLRDRLLSIVDFWDDRLLSILAAGVVPFHVADLTGGVFILHPTSNSMLMGLSSLRTLDGHLVHLRKLLSLVPGVAVPKARAQVRLAIVAAYLRYVRQRLRSDHRASRPFALRSAAYRHDLIRSCRAFGLGHSLRALMQLPASAVMGLILRLRAGRSATSIRKVLPPECLPYLTGDRTARAAFQSDLSRAEDAVKKGA